MIIVTNHDFVVVEQLRGSYVQHIFTSKSQFENWRKDHPGKNMVARTNARGRQLPSEDHRYEFEY